MRLFDHRSPPELIHAALAVAGRAPWPALLAQSAGRRVGGEIVRRSLFRPATPVSYSVNFSGWSSRNPMAIAQKVRDLINNAWTDGYVCLLATVGADGPNISPKGSMLVFDDQHLAYWERSKKKALENLQHDNRVVMMYANFKAQRDGVLPNGFLRFFGTAELHESGAIHDAIFARLSKREQEHAGADTGIGVLIKIDRAADLHGNSLL